MNNIATGIIGAVVGIIIGYFIAGSGAPAPEPAPAEAPAPMAAAPAQAPEAAPAMEEPVLTAEDNQVLYRKFAFRAMGGNMKAIGMILKGEGGDPANITFHADAMAMAAKALPAAMKPNVTPTNEKTTALPLIWQEWDKFNEGLTKLRDGAAALAAAAASGDQAAIGAQMGQLGDVCKDCHKTYREKKE